MTQLTYTAPTADWDFIFTRFLRLPERTDLPEFAALDADDLHTVVAEAARFHVERLLPLSLTGDQEGARLESGRVVTPAGYRQAWDEYRAAGWPFISVPDELGGGGMPAVMAAVISELRMSTAHSFAMYGAFCYAAATMIGALGDPWMREQMAPRLACGDWTATMCLTEGQAGSDLRQISTKAVPQADGTWRISGEKVFISGGDHDLTDNIVHIVLAKVAGDDGRLGNDLGSINVFVVPKRLIDTTSGAVGAPNGVSVTSIEHKMGIEGSATCTMAFDDAVGWRICDDTKTGLANAMGPMFFMMNKARVSTALAGVAYAELTYQVARNYARDRLAGRAPDGPHYPDLPADPLIVHPDIRRLLLTSRSFAEGGRALAMRVGVWQAESEALDSARSHALVDLLTPVLKAYFTDKGFDCAVNCQQVLGGHGYLRDYGLEQCVRNARVGQIYEGANGIHARDLVRTLRARDGAVPAAFFSAIDEFARASAEHPAIADLIAPLVDAAARLQDATRLAHDLDETSRAAVAYDLLTAYGILAIGWTWLELAATADQTPLAESKRALARIWIERELPNVDALCRRIAYGGAALAQLPDDQV